MSDMMLFGVLGMPFEMAMGDELSRVQFWQRAQQAATRIQSDAGRIAELERQNAELRQDRTSALNRISNLMDMSEAAKEKIAELETQLAASADKPAATVQPVVTSIQEQELLLVLQELVKACAYVRPLAGTVMVESKVAQLRQAGRFMNAVDSAKKMIEKINGVADD